MTSETTSQIFGTCICYFFDKRIKLEKGKNRLSSKKRQLFLMKMTTKIKMKGKETRRIYTIHVVVKN